MYIHTFTRPKTAICLKTCKIVDYDTDKYFFVCRRNTANESQTYVAPISANVQTVSHGNYIVDGEERFIKGFAVYSVKPLTDEEITNLRALLEK